MADPALAGLAVSAHDNAAASTATFQGVPLRTDLAPPAGFSDADVGSPASAPFDGTGFLVSGGGADVWGASDQFNFAGQGTCANKRTPNGHRCENAAGKSG